MTVRHAILYARSPRGSGTSIDAQIRLLADYATSRGWSYSVAVDSGPGRTRTGLESALEILLSSEVGILAVDPSRLCRDVTELLRFVRMVEAAGARVAFTLLDERDPARPHHEMLTLGKVEWLRAMRRSQAFRAAQRQRRAG